MPTEIQQLSEKIRAIQTECFHLRKRQQQWRRFSWLGVVIVLVVALMGARGGLRQQIIAGTGFVLLGERDEKRAEFGVNEDGSVVLSILGPDGDARLTLGVTKDGTPGIELCDRDGAGRIHLAIDEQNHATISLSGKNVGESMSLSVNKEGSPQFKLSDANDDDRLSLAVKENGLSIVEVIGQDGKGRVGISAGGTLGFAIRDDDDLQRVGLGWQPGPRGGPVSLSMRSSGSQSRAEMGVLPDGASVIQLTDRNGNTRFKAENSSEGMPAISLNDSNSKETTIKP